MPQQPAALTGRRSSSWLMLMCILSLRAAAVLPASESITVCSMSQIPLLRTCGQCCLAHCYGYCNGLDELDVVLGCQANSCYCKTELQPLALSHMSSCVGYYCSDADAITSWQNVYLSYCAMTHGAQYAVPTGSSAPTTVDPGNGGGGTVVSTVPLPTTVTADPSTVVSTLKITLAPTLVSLTSASTYVTTSANGAVATITNSTVDVVPVITVSGDGSALNSGLSTSDKIALGVGIGIGLPSFVAAMFFGYFQVRQHLANANANANANMR